MPTKFAVCFKHQAIFQGRLREPQWRYWDGAHWYGGFDRAHDFGSAEAAQAFADEESADWQHDSKWLGRCDPPFVTNKEEQV